MGVRTAVASGLIRAAKAFGGTVPDSFTQGEEASQMTPASPFGPGAPIQPYDGYDRTPRSHDFTTGYNIATRPRTHERVSFDTLRGLIDAYDVAQICIWHRIDSIRSLDWKLIAADGYSGDVTDAIATGMAALRKPDRENSFSTWLARYLWDVLAFDAGALYRMRNRAGRCVGLRVIDGTGIAPLLDYWGNSPESPAEAYVQYVNGLPWNWLTRDDLVYEPFRPRTNSPYGHAPLESIILTANTDIRFQVYFLQRFTEGNIHEAFASAPETWSPDQIEQFQAWWDAMVYGDQSQKHQIKWMPGGSGITWSNKKDFTDAFSLFLMRKSAAAYHVVPSDLGFTETVNLSSSESQADVQHRVGDLPLINHVERIVTAFLQDDLGLPLKHAFDRGEEQEDQAAQATADGQYIDRGVISPSEIREMRYGLSEPAGQMVPRYIFTARSGPVPLSALYGVAGRTDAETGAPDPHTPLPHEAFTGVQGVIPNPPLASEPLAEQEFGPKALPPAPPPQPQGVPVATDPNAPKVAKEAAGDGGAPAEGITSDTGLYGYDLAGRDDDEDHDHIPEDEAREAVAKAELASFRRFARARRKAGKWRDFEFAALAPVEAHRLNDAGRLAVRKAAGEIAVAGLAVLAADTGRVLMLQRALDPDDPAGGKWEFPGGHIEGDEKPIVAAAREWSEETGAILPLEPEAMAALAFGNGSSWTSGNGIYQGFVYPVPSESCVPVRCDTVVSNPDDPDSDQVEAIAWWNPADLPGNPAARPELLADIGAVMDALGCGQDDCCGAECCSDGCCDGSGGCTCGPADVAKAADPQVPKAPAGDGQPPPVQSAWPGWDYDLQAAAYWAPLLAAAFTGALDAGALAEAWLKLAPVSDASTKPERLADLTAQAAKWLADRGTDFGPAVTDTIEGVLTDGYAIGAVSADAAAEHLGSIAADMGDWEPGASSVARELAGNLGAGDGLSDLLRQADVKIKSIAETRLNDLAKVLADGAERGLSQDEMADAIKGMLSDPSRARMIVATELARAANNAAAWAYRLHAVELLRFSTAEDAKVCPECDAAEALGARPLDDLPSPPLHPFCRCAITVA